MPLHPGVLSIFKRLVCFCEGVGPAFVSSQEHAPREGRVHSRGLPEDSPSVHHGVSRHDQQDAFHR